MLLILRRLFDNVLLCDLIATELILQCLVKFIIFITVVLPFVNSNLIRANQNYKIKIVILFQMCERSNGTYYSKFSFEIWLIVFRVQLGWIIMRRIWESSDFTLESKWLKFGMSSCWRWRSYGAYGSEGEDTFIRWLFQINYKNMLLLFIYIITVLKLEHQININININTNINININTNININIYINANNLASINWYINWI